MNHARRSDEEFLMTQTPQAALYSENALAVHVQEQARTDFICTAFLHLTGAVLTFIAIKLLISRTVATAALTNTMLDDGCWLIVLGFFFAVSWPALSWVSSATSNAPHHDHIGRRPASPPVRFASAALIFWSTLHLLTHFNSRD